MANVKISQLPAATVLTSDDLLPIVENGAGQTQKATFENVLTYVTSSTFDSLTVDGPLVADVEVSGNITASSYSLSYSDHGKTLLFSSSAAQAVTCSSGLATGFNVTCVQLGLGQLDFTGSGVTLVNRFAHTSSAGQYSAVSVVVLNASQYLLVGDTD
jgi:hypothetical protein